MTGTWHKMTEDYSAGKTAEERAGKPEEHLWHSTNMPCASTHLMLSDRVLMAWREDPSAAPFPVESPRAVQAFLHGALAPDMGFIPGIDRFVSELSHYHSTADLVRELVRSAGSEEETAFAWGWVTHFLGDVAIHPLVGRATGERVYGDRSRRINAAEDVSTHVAIEVGLDIVLLDRYPDTTPPPCTPFFGNRSIGYLSGVLARTYRIPWSAPALLRSHRKAVRRTVEWPRALRVLARARGIGAGGWGSKTRLSARALLGVIRRLVHPDKRGGRVLRTPRSA